MNTSNTETNTKSIRQVAESGLAVVGFLALIALGVWGAIYSSRYVPTTVDRLGTAAVYVGSLLTPARAPDSSTTPTASSTIISFGTTASSTKSKAPSSPVSVTIPARKTYVTTPLGDTAAAPRLYGQSDLVITIGAIGYMNTTATDSFVSSTTVPSGSRPAVKFTIKNIGTNVAGPWVFKANIPTRTSYTYTSARQQSLNPGDSIDYTLGFDRASSGKNQPITITVNPDNTTVESSTKNNSISAVLTIL